MFGIKNLILFLFLITFSSISYASSGTGCELPGSICVIEVTRTGIGYVNETDSDGNLVTATLLYQVKGEKTTEDGDVIASNVKEVDVKEIELNVKLNNCPNYLSCGIDDFRTYTDNAIYNSLALRALFQGSKTSAAQSALDKLTNANLTISLTDIIDVMTNFWELFDRPVYLKFLSQNGKVIGYVRLGIDLNGNTVITENVAYDSDPVEGNLLHGSLGFLGRDDFLRDITYTRHRIKVCKNQSFTYTDFDGSISTSQRTVCYFDWL